MTSLKEFFPLGENLYGHFFWDAPYPTVLQWQEELGQRVAQNPKVSYLLVGSHPHCLTMGRGVRQVSSLSQANSQANSQAHSQGEMRQSSFPFPLHHIHRGGGLTFHYPGQVIIYPIARLHPERRSLSALISWLLSSVGQVMEEMYGAKSEQKRNPLGLWAKERKLASVGVGVKKFVSQHGLALNFFHDEVMFQALKSLSPCGLTPSIYQSVEGLLQRRPDRQEFVHHWLKGTKEMGFGKVD